MMTFLARIPTLGFPSVYASPLDTKIIIALRFFRFFAFGGSTIILVLFLHTLGISKSRIGLFLSLTLVADLLSFLLILCADNLGRKNVLALGAALMASSGIVMAASENWWVILGAGMLGVVSPNGREIGPFSAIEESILAHLTPPPLRSDIFAWYTVIGSAGSAVGKLVTGFVVQYLQALEGWDQLLSYRAVLCAYAALGGVNTALSFALSEKIELGTPKDREGCDAERREEEPLLIHNNSGNKAQKKSLFSSISRDSRGVLLKLCILFAVDSLASGLTPASWVTYFFNIKFSLPTGSLGTIFFVMGILSAISSLVAASLSKRIGLVQTMVFTHLPSAIALALIPMPSSLCGATFFLVLRSSLASMDIAPKAAFLSMIVLPEERTTVMGLISVVRTASQSCGPVITGVLAQAGKFWITFVVAGSLKAAYDLALLLQFRTHKVECDRKGVSEEPGEEEDPATGRP